MAITPFVIDYYHIISNKLSSKLPFQTAGAIAKQEMTPDQHEQLDDHIIIIGYGINGKNVAKAARHAQIPYIIVELNAVTVKKERLKGEPIMYGDAVHGMILAHVNINRARVVVIAISDPVATKRIIASIRQLSDTVHIIVRARFVQEMDEIFRLGADEVIPEEFETSIEIFTRVLSKYLVPRDEIESFTDSIRAGNYDMLRSISGRNNSARSMALDLPDIEVASVRVQAGEDSIIGKTLIEAELRKRFNVTIVAIKRQGNTILDINGNTRIQQNDIVYVLGKHHDVMQLASILRGS